MLFLFQDPHYYGSGWSAFWITLPPTVAAIVSGLLSLRNGRKTDRVAKSTSEIAISACEIEKQGNGRLDAQEKKLAEALKEVSELKVLVAQLLPRAREAGIKEAEAKGH